MTALIAAFFVAALIAPALFARMGRNAFFLMSAVPAAGLIYSIIQAPRALGGAAVEENLDWLPSLGMSFAVRLDPLAWVMSLLVTGVGCLVLIYSARYFEQGDPSIGRFAGVLMAFAGMMYGLVVANELLVLYIFWEGTTVFSYLLIGHTSARRPARQAALQALIVTTFGGLAMLVGMIMLGASFGTGRISQILAAGFDGSRASGLVITAIILILLGAISKSALIPFHFWLPAAMAAPTPVSAYLHAAAMVKAGIYLVLRLAPEFHDVPGWMPILLICGIATVVAGGWMALRQFDLKLVLAYGTVSQLGLLMLISAFGTRDTATAAIAMLISHALFKSCLFLVVGVIDHEVGTRDLRKLSGIGRSSPVLAISGTVAAASMAGIPPLLGFVGKESVYSTLLSHGTNAGILAFIGIFVGSILTVAYSARFVLGAFTVKKGVKELHACDRAPVMMTPIVLLSALCLVLGPASSLLDPLVAAHSSALPGEGKAFHLALWHGFEPALWFSLLTLALGAALVVFREAFSVFQSAMPDGISAVGVYRGMVRGVEVLASWVTARTQRGSLPFYQAVIYVVAIATLGYALAINQHWPTDITVTDSWVHIVIALCMIPAAIAATVARKRFAAVVLVGVSGYGMVAFFASQGAPDLALTQILVESITIVVFVLVLRRLPPGIGQAESRFSPSLRAILGAAFGALMMGVAVVAMAARQAAPISEQFGKLAYEIGHGKNIVNVTLVDIRAWDTLGELSVVVVAATGVASLIFVRSREGKLQRIDPTDRLVTPAVTSGSSAQSDATNARREADHDAWLLAGRTMAPRNRSILLEVTVRLLFHPMMIFSVYLLFAGHNFPGGGFAAGLVAGLALIARYLAGGRYELAEAARADAGKLLGAGLSIVALTAVGGFVWGSTILQSAYFEFDVPLLGHVSFGTSTIFDIGVYLVVVGLMLDILRSLGAQVDLYQENDEKKLQQSLTDVSGSADGTDVHEFLEAVDEDHSGRSRGGHL